MQKVEGSSPFSRSHESPAPAGFSVVRVSAGALGQRRGYHARVPTSEGRALARDSGVHEAESGRGLGGVDAAGHAELSVDVHEVGLDGRDADVHACGDLFVAAAFSEEGERFALAWGERFA